jgi:phosphoenolpyruvate-protein kinase (PTS system EI component)
MPVTIRLLDIGGDKRLPYFDCTDEYSPFLGLRGIRLLLKNPELLRTQLRALLKFAAIRDLRILLPMVSIPEEIIAVKKIVRSCQNDLYATAPTNTIQIGSMIETPSSAIAINKIVKASDFISIGTNDLTQYVMAASRENPNVADLYEKGFDYILPLIQNVAKVCKNSQIECCICGENANDETFLKRFIECGITQFSVSPFRIPHLKDFVKRLDL